MLRGASDDLERNGDRSGRVCLRIEPAVARVHKDGVTILDEATGIGWRDATDRLQGLAGDARFAHRLTCARLLLLSDDPCLPWGGSLSLVVFSRRVGSDSSTKTAGGSLAGKESIEASSTRRSSRFHCSSDEEGSFIWTNHRLDDLSLRKREALERPGGRGEHRDQRLGPD
jgi:hypothetical protein